MVSERLLTSLHEVFSDLSPNELQHVSRVYRLGALRFPAKELVLDAQGVPSEHVKQFMFPRDAARALVVEETHQLRTEQCVKWLLEGQLPHSWRYHHTLRLAAALDPLVMWVEVPRDGATPLRAGRQPR